MNDPKWEYYVENDLQLYQADALGKEGWELVSVVLVERAYRVDREAWFKRRLPSKS